MATLTGAQGIATGKRHAAIYCNDDDLEAKMTLAGKQSGDLVFPVPYCPEFFRAEFNSKVGIPQFQLLSNYLYHILFSIGHYGLKMASGCGHEEQCSKSFECTTILCRPIHWESHH
jgi:hypothetical protein